LLASGGKRCHARPDLIVDSGQEQLAEVDRMVELGGAKVPWEYPTADDFVVVADTEGNRFCIVNVNHSNESAVQNPDTPPSPDGSR